MQVTVYHHDFHAAVEGRPAALVAVATVHARAGSTHPDALEWAWRRTQNIAGSWSRGPLFDGPDEPHEVNGDHHPAVTVLAPLPVVDGKVYGLRSSMVGDVFEVGGRRYEVAMLGFKEIAA